LLPIATILTMLNCCNRARDWSPTMRTQGAWQSLQQGETALTQAIPRESPLPTSFAGMRINPVRYLVA
ncbi:MAG: hypothetical protein RSD12_03370, partial [Akkermansia sp.]